MEEVIAGGMWPGWAILVIMLLGFISYMAFIYSVRGGGNAKMIGENAALKTENIAMLKEMLAHMKKPAPDMMEHTALPKEIAAGQAEIIRLLKAVVPAGMDAAGVPPPAAAAGDGGNRDVRIGALEDKMDRLLAEVEALKGGTGGTRRRAASAARRRDAADPDSAPCRAPLPPPPGPV